MAMPRSLIVDEAVTPWYHCVSRCVRRAFLCGAGFEHRKQWIEDRLKDLVEVFAIDCAGFAVMDNHMHVLLRLDSARAAAWSDEEVARRWLRLFPLRGVDGQALPVSEARVQQLAEDADALAKARKRLVDLGWFMKCLKEPLARLANKEEGCSGAFWEGRFRSVAVLDEESLLATLAYIDLNPVAAGMAPTPEESAHTSLRTRLDECRAEGTWETLRDGLSTETGPGKGVRNRFQTVPDTFSGPSETSPSNGDRFKYAGMQYDSATGLYFDNARYYDPSGGRFVGRDPTGFASGDQNLYRYTWNQPTDYRDPSGLDSLAVLRSELDRAVKDNAEWKRRLKEDQAQLNTAQFDLATEEFVLGAITTDLKNKPEINDPKDPNFLTRARERADLLAQWFKTQARIGDLKGEIAQLRGNISEENRGIQETDGEIFEILNTLLQQNIDLTSGALASSGSSGGTGGSGQVNTGSASSSNGSTGGGGLLTAPNLGSSGGGTGSFLS